MKFERTLTPKEVELLGNNPGRRLHSAIDMVLKHIVNTRNVLSVESRILSLMSDFKPMNARDIMEAHNAIYGDSTITLSYTRFIINGMYQSQLLKRVNRGQYIKGGAS